MSSNLSYQAPLAYVGIFYALLVAWTVICVFKLGSRAIFGGAGDTGQWLMIAFVIAYTWYFSVKINYRVSVDENGDIELTSFKQVVRVNARDIPLVEGPRLPIGFVRFRLAREKAYLFCLVKDEELRKVLQRVRSVHPEIQFKLL